MTQPKVLIHAPHGGEPRELREKLEEAGLAIAYGDLQWQKPRGDHEGALAAAARDAVAMMGTSIRATPVSRRVLEASQRLRIVAKYTVGVDDVDVDAATELGILVCHAPTEANCFGVAETTMTFLLAMLKKVRERDAAVRAGGWRTPDLATTFVGSRQSDGYPGITIGLVGLGRIGTRVAQLLAPWRVRLLACDPYIEPARFLLAGASPVDYETLLRQSDVVSFHVVLTKETHHMLSERELAWMKPTATVINTARGKVIDEAALAGALAAGRLRGAAIDAFEEEPVPSDSPLRQLGTKVLMSPHAASYNDDPGSELRPGMEWATRSVLAALAGQVPDNVYNKAVIGRWRERFGGASVTP
ncbi:MAG TPA: NAD(P)-dependent oxidoreductase [Stellaceae bacterium]|nr:NAD(P)-dependent oxidoreductase [Stellaceae bacterium]